MKGKNLIFAGVIALIVGVLMLIFRVQLANGGIVFAAGALFVGAGLLNMTVFLGSRDKEGRARMGAIGTAFGWIASAAAVVLGLAMLIFPKAFVALTGFMFAILLLFAALFQMFLLIFGARPHKLSNLFFIVPTVLVGAAVYIFMRKPDTTGEITDMTFLGLAFSFFGVMTIVEGSLIGKANHTLLKKSRQAEAIAADSTENEKESAADPGKRAQKREIATFSQEYDKKIAFLSPIIVLVSRKITIFAPQNGTRPQRAPLLSVKNIHYQS